MLLRAYRLFFFGAGHGGKLQLTPPRSPPPKPQTTWHSSETTRSPPDKNLREATEPTGNPPGTHPKPHLKAEESTSHPLGFITLFIRGKRDAVGNEALSSIIQRLFL